MFKKTRIGGVYLENTREVCYVTDGNGKPVLVYVTPEQFDRSVHTCGGALVCHLCLVTECATRSRL